MTAGCGHRRVVAAALLATSVMAPVALPAAEGDRGDPATVGEARFPHALHADDLGLDCADCHHETDAARLRMPHDEYFEDFWIDCRICHRENGSPTEPQSCGACHHASPTSTTDETLSAKVVIHSSCWGCHESGTGEEASRSCGFCHQAPPAAEDGS